MKVIISGGGTGGHIYPALSICRALKERNSEVLYVGKKDSLEEELAKKAGIDFASVESAGFPRKVGIKMIKALFVLFKGILSSFSILKKFSPDIVMGTGGFVSVPIVFSAQLKKIPTAVHEANGVAGLANKLLAKRAKLIFLTLKETKISTKGRIVFSGNPVRDEFLKPLKVQEKNKNFVLSFGGSGGQKGLNDSLSDIIKGDLLDDDTELIHITGRRFYKSFLEGLGDYRTDKYKVLEYSDDIANLMRVSDIIIGSSGMMTITEITASGKPSILIPKPYTTENHQEFNARALEKAGASVVFLERNLNAEVLSKCLRELLADKDKLSEMGANSKKLFKENSDAIICDELKSLITK